MIKLVLTDMDGTLLPAGQEAISHRAQEAIDALNDAGIMFGPASGRDWGDVIKFFYDDVRYMQTAVLSNGQKIYLEGTLQKSIPYDRNGLERLKDLIDQTPGALLAIPLDEKRMAVMGNAARRWQEFPNNWFPMEIEMQDELPEGEIAKAGIACMGEEPYFYGVLEALQAAVPEIRLVCPIVNWIDLVAPQWSKAEGIKWLSQHLGLSLDEICVFGDSANDAEMLELIPCSVAVADASPEALQAARFRIGNSYDDAVAEAFFEIARAAKERRDPQF